ncbi:MAG TPA: A/G-specific adenine glycosylase [Candidatus Bathyarchaeia archaeon]|nr:A/G-specific adenine glycosylase [Candidatus Bathyarchaeia archaeon]
MIYHEMMTSFQKTVWQFYNDHGRSFPWRHIENPYYVMVSEIMLQQTQTDRVIAKYEEFITQFSDIFSLARASLHDVLSAWQGLGYNRRGKFLQQCAQQIVQKYGGIVPEKFEHLIALPGIGKATAGSIPAFAYNMPTIFIETNIRAVFIYHFFGSMQEVHDGDIEPLVAATLDQENPREWYYALMDYGVFLKKQHKNPNRKSAHYTRQSAFEGSDRQIRGAIIRFLTKKGTIAIQELLEQFQEPAERVTRIIADLAHEQLIVKKNEMLEIP